MNPNFEIMTNADMKILTKDYLSKIFPSSGIFLFVFLIIFIYSSFNQNFGLQFFILTTFALILGIVIFYLITQKHRLDLKDKHVKLQNEIVEDRIYKLDYEPGSATVPVNLLSLFFFKKIFMREMKEMPIYYIVIKGERIYLDKTNFDRTEIGKPIKIRLTENTNIFLGLKTI
jgi:hypothetical protein